MPMMKPLTKSEYGNWRNWDFSKWDWKEFFLGLIDPVKTIKGLDSLRRWMWQGTEQVFSDAVNPLLESAVELYDDVKTIPILGKIVEKIVGDWANLEQLSDSYAKTIIDKQDIDDTSKDKLKEYFKSFVDLANAFIKNKYGLKQQGSQSSKKKEVKPDMDRQNRKFNKQHPQWWASEAQKQSIFTERQSLMSDNMRLKNVIVHSLGYKMPATRVLIKGAYYTAIELPETMKEYFRQAYHAYYSRLSIVSDTSGIVSGTADEEFINMISAIMYYSFDVYSKFRGKLRYDNGKKIKIDGSEALANGLLGSTKVSYAEKWLPGIYPYEMGSVAEGYNYPLFRTTPTSLLMGARATDQGVVTPYTTKVDAYYDVVYSNKDWKVLVDDIRTTIYLSNSAAELADYLFKGIYADKGGEDKQEVWVIQPCKGEDNVTNSGGDLPEDVWWEYDYDVKTDINLGLARIRALTEMDRAIKPIFKYLGLGPLVSNAWKEWDYTRDLSSQTLDIFEVDDKFYEALVNANFEYPYQGGSADAITELMLSPPDLLTNKVVRMFKAEDIKIGDNVYVTIPEPYSYSAGEIASRLKFSHHASLLVYCDSMYMSTGDKFVAANSGTAQEATTYTAANNGWIDFAPALPITAAYENFSDLTSEITERNQQVKWSELSAIIKQFAKGQLGYGIFSGAVRPVLNSTGGNQTLSTVLTSEVDTSYQRVYVPDIDVILDYMYPHLLFDYELLKKFSDEVSRIELVYALEA